MRIMLEIRSVRFIHKTLKIQITTFISAIKYTVLYVVCFNNIGLSDLQMEISPKHVAANMYIYIVLYLLVMLEFGIRFATHGLNNVKLKVRLGRAVVPVRRSVAIMPKTSSVNYLLL